MHLLKQISLLALTLLTVLPSDLSGQIDKKEMDKKAIKAMLGCFDVEFKYTETFSPEVDYEKAYDYTSAATEWAELVEETEDKIVIQHLLVLNDTIVIKHWRQDWIYEENKRYRFDKDTTWTYETLPTEKVAGTWTQNVYQVDDSPRYTGHATWTHVDGTSRWFNIADSPLPRREATKRDDYNLMKRGNRVHITDYGWLHEQDNDKVIRTDTSESLLVQEKGYNVYKKREAGDCKAALDYWKTNHEMWSNVRDAWQDIYSRDKKLVLHKKVDGKKLYEHLFFSRSEMDKDQLHSLINKYVVETK